MASKENKHKYHEEEKMSLSRSNLPDDDNGESDDDSDDQLFDDAFD
jgi:hypothetical protein